MKTFISRLLLLAAGVLCLSCTSPVHGKDGDKEKIETLQKALTDATEDSKPVTIEATFDEACDLIQNLPPKKTSYDEDNSLIFNYKEKSFVLKDDGEGIESSHILYGKTKVVLFVPKAKGVAGKQ